MEVDELINSGISITNEKVVDLYKQIPNNWVLLEPVEKRADNRITKVKIVKYDKDKEVLRNHLLEQDDFDTLIYFFTGDDGTCKI